MLRQARLCLLFVSLVVGEKFQYPEVRRDETVVDDYYGVSVKDPYRWLEVPDSPDVKTFIESQNAITDEYINKLPVRSEILKKLTEVFNYPKFTIPEKEGHRYFHFKNTGLQNQDVLYVQDSLEAEPTVFFDPNKLSADGTVAISLRSYSDDGELLAYGLSNKGSDWISIRIRNVSTGEDFPEILNEVKFSGCEWTHDNLGFFYGRYPQEVRARSDGTVNSMDGTETDKVTSQKIYYHRVGTSQAEDVLVVEFPNEPSWLIGDMSVTRDGNYLLVYPSRGSGENQVYYVSLVGVLKTGIRSKFNLVPVVDKFGAEYTYITSEGSVIYFITNSGAPNNRVVGIDLNRPEERYWATLVPENPKLVLQWAKVVNQDKLILGYLEDVKSKLEVRFFGNGSFIQDIPIEIGSVNQFSGKRVDNEFFFNFVSFLTPGRAYRVDLTKQPYEALVYRETKTSFDASKLTVKQVFYKSKDGTRVPMFLIHKKDYVPQSNSPTFLYGYGGFNVNILPSFKPERIIFVQNFNGVFAIPNIRGGGEYGQEWHHGGNLLNKQNVFDDFQAAAEYLIAEKYTVSSKLAINGGSNGGLLVAACVNQRPELYGAGIAQVGVHDLLRFQKFTIGYAWCSEYGCSDDGNKTHFENLYKLSPIHNVRLPKDEKVQYPSVLLLTADHDDRVVPLHSYKLAAELQHTVGRSSRQTNPLFIRVYGKAGHGAGKPTSAKISEFADIFAFLVKSVGFTFQV